MVSLVWGVNVIWKTYKSAPIVALYWLLNRLLTYWFMRDVLPTLNEALSLNE